MSAVQLRISGGSVAESEPGVLASGQIGCTGEIGPGFREREGGGAARIGDHSLWPDAWLVTAARSDEPDLAALNELAVRFGRPLWQRCMRLTGNRDRARDLAQETWFRLMRTRRSLRPEKNFRAYLTTVATNLWRDQYRAARRAGAMAGDRLVALDATAGDGGAEPVSMQGAHQAPGCPALEALAEGVPDAQLAEADAQRLACEELNHILGGLSALHRELLLARFCHGESCANIGRRYARTEQTISSWVREALAQARGHLGAMNQTTCGHDGSARRAAE